MSAIANLALLLDDGTTTWTHEVNSVGGGKAIWTDFDVASSSAGAPSAVMTHSRASAARPTDKVTTWYNMPLEHTVDGVVRVYDIARLKVEATLPETMTAQQRKDFYALAKNFFSSTVAGEAMKDLNFPH